jgi:hypothetical protein
MGADMDIHTMSHAQRWLADPPLRQACCWLWQHEEFSALIIAYGIFNLGGQPDYFPA